MNDGINAVVHHLGHVLIGKAHAGTRGHVVFGMNDFAVTGDDHLVDGSQIVQMDVLCGVGPSQGGSIVEVATGADAEVFWLQGHVIVDIGRYIVEHGLGPAGIVDLIDDKPTVATASPAPVEVEEVAVVVAVANKGMTTAVAETRVIDRPANVVGFLQHVLPVDERIIVAALE